MCSPAEENTSSKWVSHYFHNNALLPHSSQLPYLHEDPSGRRRRNPGFSMLKVYTRKKITTPHKVEEQSLLSIPTPKVCVDCQTSITPLWRNGPAGPKSLCNACGLRYRKKERRQIDCVEMGGGGGGGGGLLKNEKQTALFLQRRKFTGTEEAEAAEMLMAMSSGLSAHS